MPAGLVKVMHSIADTFKFPIQRCSIVVALLRTDHIYDVRKSVWACTENRKSSQGARLAPTIDKRAA